MGFSPGDFANCKEAGGESFHWEGKAKFIALWDDKEMNLILALELEEARKAHTQLGLLIQLMEGDGL